MISRFRTTIYTFGISFVLYIIVVAGDLDLFETLLKAVHYFEKYELDELLLFASFVLVAFVFDLKLSQKVEVHEQRLQVLKATMRAVQDIVNNFLNNLHLIRIELAGTVNTDDALWDQLEKGIEDTAAKLNALADMQDTPEKEIAAGITAIDYEND